VHTYYWDDDQPMMYFGDVRGHPAYCAAHVAPLESLPADLASAATTPDFAWIAPDDCSDMEGCGIRAGDDFLARELGMIMRSPAAVAVTPDGRTVYVANEGSGTVTPIDTATRRPGRAIKVGAAPVALAITPNGRMIYVVSEGSSTVTPIATPTNRPGNPITVGAGPRAIVMTPAAGSRTCSTGWAARSPRSTRRPATPWHRSRSARTRSPSP
jgi:YVTN family beta-propeller protein